MNSGDTPPASPAPPPTAPAVPTAPAPAERPAGVDPTVPLPATSPVTGAGPVTGTDPTMVQTTPGGSWFGSSRSDAPQAGAPSGAPSPAPPSTQAPGQAPPMPDRATTARPDGGPWTPLGPTPDTPPVRSQAGGPYLPPVAPPNQQPNQQAPAAPAPTTPNPIPATTTPTPASTKAGSRWGWRAAFSFLAGGLVAAAGFGAAQIGRSDDEPTAQIVEASEVTTTTAPPPSTSIIVDLENIEEPAALVAATLGPAVVQIETDIGLGSGVIYDDGLILTNNHVVEGSRQLRVRLSTGETIDGDILGTHEPTDVAVVSVGPGRNLPIAPLATGEKIQVGQTAIAIGSPFQLQQSVTAGIVSAVNRPIPNRDNTSVTAMIQTDAPINPGNSGGALSDRRGRVIGINTSIFTDSLTPSNSGIGFAIPIDTAIRLADLIVAGEPIVPGFLGVEGAPPPPGEIGVQIASVTAGSAAETAGLLVGDRVLSLDGAPVTEITELAGLVLARQAGDTVVLDVVRDGEQIQIEAVLGARDG